jgi:HEPN domain-containing protein
MLSRAELRKIARARVNDAKVLFKGKRYDGAVYVCGYAMEIALKARIVATLGLLGFPETIAEFKLNKNLRTHDLDLLLKLSGREQRVKNNHLAEWSGVAQWEPEARYRRIGLARRADALAMIQATDHLLKVV